MTKRYDGEKILGDLSGLGKVEVHNIWLEVKANAARLGACEGPHDFGPPAHEIGARYTCSRCGGVLNAVNRSWYEKGLSHGYASRSG